MGPLNDWLGFRSGLRKLTGQCVCIYGSPHKWRNMRMCLFVCSQLPLHNLVAVDQFPLCCPRGVAGGDLQRQTMDSWTLCRWTMEYLFSKDTLTSPDPPPPSEPPPPSTPPFLFTLTDTFVVVWISGAFFFY